MKNYKDEYYELSKKARKENELLALKKAKSKQDPNLNYEGESAYYKELKTQMKDLLVEMGPEKAKMVLKEDAYFNNMRVLNYDVEIKELNDEIRKVNTPFNRFFFRNKVKNTIDEVHNKIVEVKVFVKATQEYSKEKAQQLKQIERVQKTKKDRVNNNQSAEAFEKTV